MNVKLQQKNKSKQKETNDNVDNRPYTKMADIFIFLGCIQISPTSLVQGKIFVLFLNLGMWLVRLKFSKIKMSAILHRLYDCSCKHSCK